MVLLAPPGDCCRRIRVLPEPEKVTFMDLITDLLALLDALNLSKVFLIGKDFGVSVVSIFTLLHQDKVLGFVTIGIPFSLPRPATYIESLPEGYYISRWQDVPKLILVGLMPKQSLRMCISCSPRVRYR